MANDIANYAIAFLLTVMLETAVALLFGYRKPADLAAVFWVNVFSHPAVHCLLRIISLWQATPIGSSEILVLECGIVLAEWQLLCYALPRHSKTRLLILSLVMNGVSYFLPLLCIATSGLATGDLL